jgi:hypothetical protein
MHETGIAGDDQMSSSEEDQSPIESETPDVGGVVEVDASGCAEEVCEVEGRKGRGAVASWGSGDERRGEEGAVIGLLVCRRGKRRVGWVYLMLCAGVMRDAPEVLRKAGAV